MLAIIIKPLIIIHRYVGVVLGVIMTLWCLSGFVMMYQGFPGTSQEERRAGLEPLDLAQCCAELPREAGGNVRIEMLNGKPVARSGGRGGQQTYDLTTGEKVGTLDKAASGSSPKRLRRAMPSTARFPSSNRSSLISGRLRQRAAHNRSGVLNSMTLATHSSM